MSGLFSFSVFTRKTPIKEKKCLFNSKCHYKICKKRELDRKKASVDKGRGADVVYLSRKQNSQFFLIFSHRPCIIILQKGGVEYYDDP